MHEIYKKVLLACPLDMIDSATAGMRGEMFLYTCHAPQGYVSI